jgi:hypothetical protein
MAEWMRGPLQGFVGEGLAVIDGSEALPKVETGCLLDDFERGRLPWSRVWQFVVLGHWLKDNFLDNNSSHIAGVNNDIKVSG